MSNDCKELACTDCKCSESEVSRPVYEVILTLNDKAYNEEFKLWVLNGIEYPYKVIISKTPDVIVELNDTWRINDLVRNEGVDTVIVNKK